MSSAHVHRDVSGSIKAASSPSVHSSVNPNTYPKTYPSSGNPNTYPKTYPSSTNPNTYPKTYPKALPIPKEKILEVLERHDLNGDERLSKAELKKAFAELGSKYPCIQANLGIRAADDDGDGFIDFNNQELDNLIYYIRGLSKA